MTIAFVLPGDVDDVTVPSGGNHYDRRVCRGLPLEGVPVREICVHGRWPTPDVEAREELARSLSALPDDTVVVLDGLVACGVPEVVVPQAHRLRMVILVHLPLAAETGLQPALAAELDARERKAVQAASAVVVTSSSAARRLADHHDLDPNRVHTVTPGADPAPPAPATDSGSRLLCVAAVTPRKAQDVLVDALARVADLPWNCRCVGPWGRDRAFLRTVRGLIARHDLAHRCALVGSRRREHLAAEYTAADLVVLPSRAETYGMVVTEALARGIPVLATTVDGVPDTLGAAPDATVPGMLVPANDPEALAEALRRWLTGGELRQRLRHAAGQRRAMLEPWEVTSRGMAAVVHRVRAGAV